VGHGQTRIGGVDGDTYAAVNHMCKGQNLGLLVTEVICRQVLEHKGLNSVYGPDSVG